MAGLSRKKIALVVVLVLALGAVAWPAYRGWHQHRSEQFRTACRTAVDDEEWDRLWAVASKWTEWDSSADDGWVFLAEAALQRNEPELTVEYLGRVDNDYEQVLETLAVRGDILLSDLNRPYEAVETWRRMLRIDPLASLARQRLIFFYSMSLQREKMIDEIHQAMELKCEPPESYAYLLLAHDVTFSDGLPLVVQWLQNYPDDEALQVARALYVAKLSRDNQLSIFGSATVAPGDATLIRAHLEKYPGNLEVLAFHLDWAIQEGHPQRVLDLLSRCPPEAEEDCRFWRARGWYLNSQDRHAEAETALRRALDLNPLDWRTRMLLATSLRRLGQVDEADEMSRVAVLGKDLHRELFELPNARALTGPIIDQVHEYLRTAAPPLVLSSFERRLNPESAAPANPPLTSVHRLDP